MSRAIDGEPNFADEEFESLAELLVHDAEPGISQREWLPKQALDYSLESLKALDEYLEVLHA